MKESEATTAVTALAAYWRVDMGQETESLWVASLTKHELEDAIEANTILGEHSIFMPSLADYLSTLTEVRNDRVRRSRKQLPPAANAVGPFVSFAEFLHDNEDYRRRVEALEGASVGSFGLSGILMAEMGRLT